MYVSPPSYEEIKHFAECYTIEQIEEALQDVEVKKWMLVHAYNHKLKERRGKPHYSEPYDGEDYDH